MEFADVSMSFKMVLNMKDDASGTWTASIVVIGTRTVIKKEFVYPDESSIGIDDTKNMIELRNQIINYQLREDDKRFRSICLLQMESTRIG